jgi:hypothetical protein
MGKRFRSYARTFLTLMVIVTSVLLPCQTTYAGLGVHTRQPETEISSSEQYSEPHNLSIHTLEVAPQASCNDPHEPNNSFDQATSITYGAQVNADICPAGDEDFYTFNGAADDRIVADIDADVNDSALDSFLYLYDNAGNELARNDDYDGFDSRIVYRLPADGVYYLKVREYAHPREGGPDYFYTLSLERIPPPLPVVSKWTNVAPNPNGYIQAGEWSDAAVYDITVVRAKGERPRHAPEKERGETYIMEVRGEQVRASNEVRTEVVRLYVKNDATHLYLAIDNPNDTNFDELDQMGIYFDDNPLPSDGQWTNNFCGNPDGEGNFWVLPDDVYYREIVAGPDYCQEVTSPEGVAGTVGSQSGHSQAEVTIDLTTSALRASPGDAIGMYLYIFNGATWTYDGWWPASAVWYLPASYGILQLARPCPTLEAPQLLAPADDASVGATPYFDWSDVVNATAYRIQVDNDADFSTPVISTTVTTSAFTPTTPLTPGTYYWRVQGRNNNGGCDVWGPWSASRRVQVQMCPTLEAPQLLAPADDASVGATPYFDWSDVVNATAYRIQVDNDADFSTPVISTTVTTSAFTPTTPLTPGTYYWRVQGRNNNGGCDVWGPWSASRRVQVQVCPTLEAPQLLAPADDASVGATPYFDWSDVVNATAYRIQVDNDADFSTPVISTTVTTSAFTPTTPLTPGTYYWRVQGRNNNGGCDVWGPWSASRRVQVQVCPTLEAPQLLAPADDASVGATPYFDWSDVVNATAYRIQVDNDADFSTPVISTTVTTSAFTPTTPLTPGTYYWRVQGRNNNGGCDVWGPWSASRRVQVRALVPRFLPKSLST